MGLTIGFKHHKQDIGKKLANMKARKIRKILDFYGKKGVESLEEYTPKKTGLTSRSWYYEIEKTPNGYSLVWKNSNIQNYINIALLIQNGHATKTGLWVEGRDYINPALKPIFNEFSKSILQEVTSK